MKTIRVGIVGQGRSGRNIHGAYIKADARRFRVVAAVDPIKERRERARAEYGCDVYANHGPLLKRDDLDLIINATPSHLHVPVTLEFLKAGFNVLCEKPLASKAKDVDALIAATRKSGALLAIFQQSRYAPYFEQVRKVIDSGVIGKAVQISIGFNGFSRRYDWQTLTDMMGGNLLNTGPHPLDQALQLFGTDMMPKVSCVMRNATSYGTADDHVTLILSGENRPIIHLEISSCCVYPCFTYHVYGTLGGLKGSTTEMEWRYYKPEEAPKLKLDRKPLNGSDGGTGSVPLKRTSGSHGTPVYCSDQLNWYTKRWRVPSSQADLFKCISTRFYTMLYKSLTTGAPLDITPEEVRQQVAVIEECQRQNPQIWGRG